MATSTMVQPLERWAEPEPVPARPPVAEWLLSMGSVVHHLDYGGRVAAVGAAPAVCGLLVAAYPLAAIDAVDARAELRCRSYDLVCLFGAVGEADDPVVTAERALRATLAGGAVMVVEPTRTDAFADGPIAVGAWLLRAGAARVRLAWAAPHGFVLDARTEP